jgi:hypothetical protein
MSFVLPIGVRSFFGFDGPKAFARSRAVTREVVTRFIMFDAYYCCLLLGLYDGKLGEPSRLEGEKFLENYPESFKGQAELIAGLLVDAELRRLRIEPDDREDIEQQMVHLLDLGSLTRLSATGDGLLNQYAVSGFDRLRDGMMAPDNLEDFLVAYHALWPVETP